MLRAATALKRLDLGGNGVGDVGGAAIAAALPSLTTLTTLDLQDNALGDHAGVAIAKALARNAGLLTLSLRANLVRDATGAALVVGLQTNESLTELDLSWNDINYSNHESITALLQEQAARCAQQRELARQRDTHEDGWIDRKTDTEVGGVEVKGRSSVQALLDLGVILISPP